jgi:ribonuclease Z
MTEKTTRSHIYDIWNYTMDLLGTQLTIKGHSRGSEQSCFYIPELKMYLDAGIGGCFNPDHIFITHCHSDHSFNLPVILTGLNRTGKKPPDIYSPKETSDLLHNFLQSAYKLRKGTNIVSGHYIVTGLEVGDVVALNKKSYFVRVYKMHHNVPTLGYGICQRRKKLNTKFKDLSGKKIKTLRATGVDIYVYIEHKIFAYVLDTNIKCFETNPELLEYKYVMVECTFFKDESSCHYNYHIHWCQLKPIIMNNPNVHFILIHFSMRYKWDDIDTFFKKQQVNIPNITYWMN